MNSDMLISQEISSYEQQLAALIALKEKVKEAIQELSDSYTGIIMAKDEFSRIKKENIEEVRAYKFSIVAECKEINSQIERINKLSGAINSGELKTFVDSCERLAALDAKGFFEKIRLGAEKP